MIGSNFIGWFASAEQKTISKASGEYDLENMWKILERQNVMLYYYILYEMYILSCW